MTPKERLGQLVRSHREQAGLSQERLAEECGAPVNRSVVAHLEQGRRIPRPDSLALICKRIELPETHWLAFASESSRQRLEFEDLLGELVGVPVSLELHPTESQDAVERLIADLFSSRPSPVQSRDLLNSILVFYGVPSCTPAFFTKYLGNAAFASLEAFQRAVAVYQLDATRLFSTLGRAYRALGRSVDLESILAPLQARDMGDLHARANWQVIEQIPDDRLPDLGYISARVVEQESAERKVLAQFLSNLADRVDSSGPGAIDDVSEKSRRKMDSLLRKFGSTITHGFSSHLFAPDADELRREGRRLAPKTGEELGRMEDTQRIALRNLAHYLASDYLDVYVATSMRTNADYVSVSRFVQDLFSHDEVRPFKLRFFNPTQSWIDDRIAKGLVEALMLRRASITIYMAQKSDTFGKDSEASVALGQGKPVVVYVPKLPVDSTHVDPELLFRSPRAEIVATARKELGLADDELDETNDAEAIVGRILTARLEKLTDADIVASVRSVWADFDLYAEAVRFRGSGNEGAFREWLDAVVANDPIEGVPTEIRSQLVGTLVAVSIGMEKRATLFREIHPLALQVILSSGVLNGILVVRTIQQCARVLRALLENRLELELVADDFNYKVIEKHTRSTVRVISRHSLLRNAFEEFYSGGE